MPAVDAGELESLMGYSARRVSLCMFESFVERMAIHGLGPAGFSVLSLVTRNPGITSRQLCFSLGIRPPNLVAIVNAMQERELIVKRPDPQDGRAVGLDATPAGRQLLRKALRTARKLEADVAQVLTPTGKQALLRLLNKVAARSLKLTASPPRLYSG